MFLLNGQPLQLDTPFTTADGTQYPAYWLRLTTDKEKMLFGITEVPEPVRADDRFYWGGDINNPRDLDQLKEQFVAQVKQTAGSMLAQTDWMVIRKADVGTDIPANVASGRTAIRAKADELETAINAVATVEELATLDLSFTLGA
jgi:hypothetical protein